MTLDYRAPQELFSGAPRVYIEGQNSFIGAPRVGLQFSRNAPKVFLDEKFGHPPNLVGVRVLLEFVSGAQCLSCNAKNLFWDLQIRSWGLQQLISGHQELFSEWGAKFCLKACKNVSGGLAYCSRGWGEGSKILSRAPQRRSPGHKMSYTTT